jgi:hypothetical protein
MSIDIKSAIVGVEKAENVTVARRTREGGSQYEVVAQAMADLDEGQCLVLQVPDNLKPQQFMNRLNSGLRRFDPDCPEGCRFVRRALEGNKVGIFCVRKNDTAKSAG